MKRESEVAQSCLSLSDPIDCSPPGSSIHGIFQMRILEWVAIAFSDFIDKRNINMMRSLLSLFSTFKNISQNLKKKVFKSDMEHHVDVP